MTTIPTDDEAVIDEVSAVLASFVRATDALTRAIRERDAAAMCDALEALARARTRTLGLFGREPLAV